MRIDTSVFQCLPDCVCCWRDTSAPDDFTNRAIAKQKLTEVNEVDAKRIAVLRTLLFSKTLPFVEDVGIVDVQTDEAVNGWCCVGHVYLLSLDG